MYQVRQIQTCGRGQQLKQMGNSTYLLVYVDDILSISEELETTIDKFKKKFPIRDKTVESPQKYLGADIKEWQLPDGRLCWSISSEQYVKNDVKTLKKYSKMKTGCLKQRHQRPNHMDIARR